MSMCENMRSTSIIQLSYISVAELDQLHKNVAADVAERYFVHTTLLQFGGEQCLEKVTGCTENVAMCRYAGMEGQEQHSAIVIEIGGQK